MTNIRKMELMASCKTDAEPSGFKAVASEVVKLCEETTVSNIPDGLGSTQRKELAEQARGQLDSAKSCGFETRRHILHAAACSAVAAPPDALRDELINVAYVALRWVEVIDRRDGKK